MLVEHWVLKTVMDLIAIRIMLLFKLLKLVLESFVVRHKLVKEQNVIQIMVVGVNVLNIVMVPTVVRTIMEVEVMVLEIDTQKRRVSLGLKQTIFL